MDASVGYSHTISTLSSIPEHSQPVGLLICDLPLDSQPPDAVLSQTDQDDLSDLEFSLFKFQYQLAVPSGFGDVWKGTYREKAVALKKLKPYMLPDRRRRRFDREASIWSKLQECPYIVPFIGITRDGDSLYMVSPWMERGNIVSYIKLNSDAPILLLIYDIVRGLEFLHHKDIVHGDLRGANILISDHGYAQICDFGLSLMLNDASEAMHSNSLQQAGNSRWMAPEFFIEPYPGISRYTDVWAFAMVVIEIFTGLPPFHESIPKQYAVPHHVKLRNIPDRPMGHELSDELWDLLRSCWNFCPQERPEADKLARDVKNLISSGELESASFAADADLSWVPVSILDTPDGHADKATKLKILASSLQSRFSHLKNVADLDLAIEILQRAVALYPDSHGDKSSLLNNLGSALGIRYKYIGNRPDLDLALSAYFQSSRSRSSSPSERLRGAQQLARLCLAHRRHLGPTAAMDAYSIVFQLVSRMVSLEKTISREYGHILAAELSETVSGAVAEAIRRGKPAQALEWLEQGQNRIWGRVLQLRYPIDGLCKEHQTEADKLETLSRILESALWSWSGTHHADADFALAAALRTVRSRQDIIARRPRSPQEERSRPGILTSPSSLTSRESNAPDKLRADDDPNDADEAELVRSFSSSCLSSQAPDRPRILSHKACPDEDDPRISSSLPRSTPRKFDVVAPRNVNPRTLRALAPGWAEAPYPPRIQIPDAR